jgi:hypothetical protein|tara:strand:- start:579 stop:797 length:219 start_codon:yes stop_codon:yes gene_type:complete
MSKLKNILAGLIIATLSCIGTMFYIVGMPVDEHIVIQNRALNYLDKTCYDMEDIEMIVFGEVLYDNRYKDIK